MIAPGAPRGDLKRRAADSGAPFRSWPSGSSLIPFLRRPQIHRADALAGDAAHRRRSDPPLAEPSADLHRSILGFIIGNLAAVILAVAFVYNKRVEQAYFPVVLFLNTIPVLAIAPIIVLIFGVGILPKVIIASIICFFPLW